VIIFRDFIRDTRGAFALYFGIGLLVLLLAIGCAIDVSQISSHKSRLNDLADNTAIAGASVANHGAFDANGNPINRKDFAEDYFEQNKYVDGLIKVNDDPDISFDDGLAEVTVTVSADVEYIIMGIFGFGDPTISATSKVTYLVDDIAPLSIAFAFDRSGSMGLPAGSDTKMAALQSATSDLFTELAAASKNPTLLATAMSTTFSSYSETLIDTSPMQTGYAHVITEVNNMVPLGGTNMWPSLEYAGNELGSKKASVGDNRWVGYVVFMTDGENDVADDTLEAGLDAETLAQCDALKAAGYQIYSVAFAAPPNGETILKACASSEASYFDSNNRGQLKQAFKTIGKEIGSSTLRIKS